MKLIPASTGGRIRLLVLLTVMLAVPNVVSRFAGTVATIFPCPPKIPAYCVWSCVPFQSTDAVGTFRPELSTVMKLEPVTVMEDWPDPTVNCVGCTCVITGVGVCATI